MGTESGEAKRYTTLTIDPATKDILAAVKNHPRETWDELLRRLVSERGGGQV